MELGLLFPTLWVSQRKSEEQQLLAEQAMIYISALPWAVKKPRGLSDDEPIHTLWRYLGPNWLSDSSQNDLLHQQTMDLSHETHRKL